MKIVLFSLSIFLQFELSAQAWQRQELVSYATVINEILNTESVELLSDKYDYTYILLLDSTHNELVEKIGYQYIEEFRSYASGLAFPSRSVSFVCNKESIQAIFRDDHELRRILESLNHTETPDLQIASFNYPIYFTDKSAVFEIAGPTWSDTYFARFDKGVVQINHLGGTIE
jgi:hypothetical protein